MSDVERLGEEALNGSAAMRRQGLKSTYLSARTNLIKCFKISATTAPCFCIGAVIASYFNQDGKIRSKAIRIERKVQKRTD